MTQLDYTMVTTTPEVWAVIMASHRKDLKVFETFSNPNGDFMGQSDREK